MLSRVIGLCAAAVLVMSASATALAAPPAKTTDTFDFEFPDPNLRLVAFMNIDRETYCTPEVVAFEEAVIAWEEGGEVGDFPELPVFPDGFDPVSLQEVETGQGAVVQLFKGSGLHFELWEMDADAQLIGPCTDTDAAMHLIGTGTAAFVANDNDIGGTGTRGNAFGHRGMATLVDEGGNTLRYTWRFEVNSRCVAPNDEPRCLIDTSRLT